MEIYREQLESLFSKYTQSKLAEFFRCTQPNICNTYRPLLLGHRKPQYKTIDKINQIYTSYCGKFPSNSKQKYSDRGWSPEKHVHRSIFYAKAYRVLGHSNFYNNIHVTLTGSGEDNRFLSDLFHVNKNNIISFDIDREVSNKCLLDGYHAVLGDVFKGLPRFLDNRPAPIATINLDLTGTLPKYHYRIIELTQQVSNCMLMITYNVNRTRISDLLQAQKDLDIFCGKPFMDHTKYRSFTIDQAGNIKMPVGSTMASVIYKL